MKIAYFILNRFDYDSRARLEVETLKKLKHQVEIIATEGASSHSYLGMPIHRIPQWRGPSRKFRFIQYNLMAARLVRRLNPDICHAVDLDTLQAASCAASSSNAKLVYEARELYTELEALAGRPRVTEIWKKLETRLIGKADRVITINESIALELARRYNIAKPAIIRNVAAVVSEAEPLDIRAKFDIPRNNKILIYQGILRKGQGLFAAIEITARLPRNISLVFVGSGPIEGDLKLRAEKLNISNRVKFAGQVPASELINYTATADAGLLLMEDVALNNRLALPQKLFQYLAANVPQIVSPMPEIAGFVKTNNTGIVVDPVNMNDAVNLISIMLDDAAKMNAMKKSCRDALVVNNWEVESKVLVDLYRSLEK
jgi:glycosyltransferase involved in cell wall biosynthesis